MAVALAAMAMTSCSDEPETRGDEGHKRPATSESSPRSSAVLEWTPAPGQFINESGDFTTAAEAAAWAAERLEKGLTVSLGAFGGYIVVGFDHSIENSGGDYDFAVVGNAFVGADGTGGSNEPGIVYVMQDTNGNGLPDDLWYELLSSESGRESTNRNYSVTYRRPTAPGEDTPWTDSEGASGTVDYLAAFHSQDFYYPSWIEADSYTLTGTCLEPHNKADASGMWSNAPYGWGYADNVGADNLPGQPQTSRFRISDAMTANGTAASLGHIDFVKVQTGVNAKSGWLGEVSTEVCGFVDLHLQ